LYQTRIHQHEFISTITSLDTSNLFTNQTQLIAIFLTILLLITYFFSDRKTKARSTSPAPSYKWPERPFPLIHTTAPPSPHQPAHYAHHAVKLMASTHNTILRGLNTI
jgi:hypothetical protein